ncbi:MAG: hypothetical protein MK211_02665 [Flavobacteriales bacterium]|jgi:hypothetical protein|nr:hypothetical protein [Flavobacteriales bacterium]
MKKTLLLLCICGSMLAFGQVGIGTVTPEADLHIAGELLVQDNFKAGTLGTVGSSEENFKLVTRTTNSTPVGEIKVLDVNSLSVAPVNVVKYRFTNIAGDNMRDVDLQYATSDYVVGVSNFRYLGDPIKKIPVGTTATIGTFVIRAFESGGSWHLEIQNRDLDLPTGDTVEYEVTLLVYDKSYFRNLPSISTNLSGSNTGTASSVPNLY